MPPICTQVWARLAGIVVPLMSLACKVCVTPAGVKFVPKMVMIAPAVTWEIGGELRPALEIEVMAGVAPICAKTGGMAKMSAKWRSLISEV